MEINEKKYGDVLVLTLTGELMGGEKAEEFQSRVYDAIEDEDVNIVVDMEKVKWMNSSGLGMLMGALTTLRSSGGDLKLANVSDRVQRPIEITKLDSVLNIYDSVDNGVNSFQGE